MIKNNVIWNNKTMGFVLLLCFQTLFSFSAVGNLNEINVITETVANIPNIKFHKINRKNILSTYEKFVRKVKANYNIYSKAEAKKVLRLWDRLNQKKSEIEPIKAKDNYKIAALKAEFAAVKVGLRARINAK